MSEEVVIRWISKSTVRPSITSHARRCDLTAWDLKMLSMGYSQSGSIFHRPQSTSTSQPEKQDDEPFFINRLKQSLSHALVHFFPLAGRLSTERQGDGTAVIFVDNNCAGAHFIHAMADVSIDDILRPLHTPPFVKSLFALNEAINHDGHTLPLLAVQVTELLDGIFISCSFNHSLVDGTSFSHFINTWSEICRGRGGLEHEISRPPIIDRWFIDHSPIRLQLSGDEFNERYTPPPLTEKIFHFTSKSIARLKAKANKECKKTDKISSFQALSAHAWRSVTKARDLHSDEKIHCWLAINNRSRLEPPLSVYCFGNYMQEIVQTTTVGELLGRDLGWAAWLLFKTVEAHTYKTTRSFVEEWVKNPLFASSTIYGSCSVCIVGSATYDIYDGIDFGWGKPIAVRSGPSNEIDGQITVYPGRERGSVDLEMCLSPDTMNALESDEEFMGTHIDINSKL